MQKNIINLVVVIGILSMTCVPVIAQKKTQEKSQTPKKVQKIYTAAILPFSERGPGVKGQGQQAADLLFSKLVENPNLWLVERSEMKKILDELELNISGLVNPGQANQIGQLTGAKLLITGSVFKVKNKTFMVAKVISTETSRVLGKSVNGKEGIDIIAAKLANGVSELINKDAEKLMPKIRTRKDIIDELKEKIGDAGKPKLFITAKEHHVGQATIDPAIETELQSICKDVGFDVTEDKEAADLIIKGEGFSEFATRRGNLISVKARVELKAVDKDGNLQAADKQTSVDVDLTELIAGKTALQNATAEIAERLLPKIVKKK